MNKKPSIKYIEKQKGDVNHTAANIDKAKNFLKYAPKFDLETGIANEVEWLRKIN